MILISRNYETEFNEAWAQQLDHFPKAVQIALLKNHSLAAIQNIDKFKQHCTNPMRVDSDYSIESLQMDIADEVVRAAENDEKPTFEFRGFLAVAFARVNNICVETLETGQKILDENSYEKLHKNIAISLFRACVLFNPFLMNDLPDKCETIINELETQRTYTHELYQT